MTKGVHKKNKKGFSLIELIVVIGIMSVLGSTSFYTFKSFQNHNLLNNTAQVIAQSLTRAQILSRAVKNDSAWGIYVQIDKATTYQGDNFASRNTAYDEDLNFPGVITAEAAVDINFEKLSGQLASSKQININLVNGGGKTITINTKGVVEY